MQPTKPPTIQENVSLAPFTTLKIGGPARYYVRAGSEEEVISAARLATAESLPLFVLGGGSNILVSDNGFDGLVLHITLAGISRKSGALVAAAGEDWDAFVAYCVKNDLAGVECLSGIPGFVGGTPVQNVGAYGQEVSESIVSVRCFDRQTKQIVELSNPECGFEYRKSIFNSAARDRYIVLSVAFALRPGGRPKVAYKDLQERFPNHQPSLAEVRTAVLDIRSTKSMVIDPSDPNSRSTGSFFKNPIVPIALLNSIKAAAKTEKVPYFPAPSSTASGSERAGPNTAAPPGDRVKIPAAWLIEHAGFHKGYRLGAAAISSNHSLALVNLGVAQATEIIELKNRIQQRVFDEFNIRLEPEPIFVGFDK